jgi:superfamily I DNA/RNA helicase
MSVQQLKDYGFDVKKDPHKQNITATREEVQKTLDQLIVEAKAIVSQHDDLMKLAGDETMVLQVHLNYISENRVEKEEADKIWEIVQHIDIATMHLAKK